MNVTPNRPDALSHLGHRPRGGGVHRALPCGSRRSGWPRRAGAASDLVRVRIEAPERCHRYAARVVEGVRIGPSPAWLARRLESCGIRSISNVVDATNFVLLELGHPLHAFDLDRVAGREIVVRTARLHERLVTLDAVDRPLDAEDLVIADRDRASALAGVMGGGDSEIRPDTSRVLIESAWFAPAGVRRTARRHGFKTEASFRFERGADPGMVLPALDRCAALVAELSGGTVRAGVVQACPRPHQPATVSLRWDRPSALLGMDVPAEVSRRVLTGLGFEEEAAPERGASASWRVPSWRRDIALEEDLVEEIVRLQGYDAIPETLPRLALERPAAPAKALAVSRIREALAASGFSEAVSFSFIPPADVAAFDPTARPIALRNPISAELGAMRTSVLPSLLRAAARNLRQRVDDVRLYEIARGYQAGPGEGDAPACERTEVAGVLVGRRSPPGWAVSGEMVDLFDAKGAVERIFGALNLGPVRWESRAQPWSHPRFSAEALDQNGSALGTVAELHPRVAVAFELPRGVLAFRLELKALLDRVVLVPAFSGVPRFPAVLRDVAVVVADEVVAEAVLAVARNEPLLEEASLFDVYTGPPIPQGKKNLALALRYRARDRTLTDAEVDAAHARLVGRLKSDPGIRAELRG